MFIFFAESVGSDDSPKANENEIVVITGTSF